MWPSKPKIFTLWSFAEKVCQPLVQDIVQNSPCSCFLEGEEAGFFIHKHQSLVTAPGGPESSPRTPTLHTQFWGSTFLQPEGPSGIVQAEG